MPKFEKVRKYSDHVGILYRLLTERQHSISHERMPSYKEHEFVNSDCYRVWQLIYLGPECLGSVYLKFDNTIGFNLKRTQVDVIAQL